MTIFWIPKSDGTKEVRIWCDNPDCYHYGGREGISPKNPQQRFLVVQEFGQDAGLHFCDEKCREQSKKSNLTPTGLY